MHNGNDTIGLNNDTIGGFAAGPAMGHAGGTKLDVTNDPNNTLNFYVSALKKEENQKSETGGEEYQDHEALDGKRNGGKHPGDGSSGTTSHYLTMAESGGLPQSKQHD